MKEKTGLNQLSIARLAKIVGEKYAVVVDHPGGRWKNTYWRDLESAESAMCGLVDSGAVKPDQVCVKNIDEYIRILVEEGRDG